MSNRRKIKKKAVGTREAEVDEPHFRWVQPGLEIEFEQVVEPKALSPKDLVRLVEIHGTYMKAAVANGASETFVRQHLKCFRRRFPRMYYHDLDEEK